MSLLLHTYWRSGAAWRVRIALSLKGLDHDVLAHDLRIGAQRQESYLALNPQGLVPALEIDGRSIGQSLAIMEWLDERFPQAPLLPSSDLDRAMVRVMAQTIACDIHPLNNLRVLTCLRQAMGAGEEQVSAWIAHWIHEGFHALEIYVQRHGGRFAFGDAPTMADCCLVPQVYSARRYGVDLSPYPAIVAVEACCAELASVRIAHPDHQGDRQAA